MLVRIFKYWDGLDMLHQTPGGRGEWRGVKFVIDEPGDADYVIIHCRVDVPIIAKVPAKNIWLVVGEPPNETYKEMHSAPKWVSRIYTNDASLTTPQHVLSRPGLPWHVSRDFDFLTTCPIPEKTRDLSWVTSSRGDTVGHQKRLRVIDRLRALPELDLFGRGFQPIADKWDGLAPYRYSIAYENYNNSHYWTEKVMDCFLAWTMPIYYGCTELEQFFPKESFIRIDPEADDLEAQVAAILQSDRRERNLDAIAEARRRVLYDYNFFEFLVGEIEKDKAVRRNALEGRRMTIIRNHQISDKEFVMHELRKLKQTTYQKLGLRKPAPLGSES